ncbi:MAG TPA: ATP-binding cassette domain-containing protein [Bacteroidia bacterium]|nr:ATP-binding cassette domain-containing protein [Bacteroidia bacterium]
MPISIHINNLGKKFVNEWIFKDVNLNITPTEKLVILGSNGSGKSTLLQSIASFLIPTKGEVVWKNDNEVIEDDTIYKHLSMASPYMELIEDFTLIETINHQKQFKPFVNNLPTEEIIKRMQLEHAADKYIKNYSSGMRQRVKLGLAIMADCPVLLLDEPCSNLDANAIAWYQNIITEFALQKTILVCSNTVKEEYTFCTDKIEIENFKVRK